MGEKNPSQRISMSSKMQKGFVSLVLLKEVCTGWCQTDKEIQLRLIHQGREVALNSAETEGREFKALG